MKETITMPLLALILFLICVALDFLIATITMMVLSSVLHENWWDAVPALGFSEAFWVGLVVASFATATSISTPKYDLSGVITKVVLALIMAPLLLPWAIGELNNSLIPVLPDMSYGTAFLFTLAGMGMAFVTGAVGYVVSLILPDSD